jgi:DNA polymerase-1
MLARPDGAGGDAVAAGLVPWSAWLHADKASCSAIRELVLRRYRAVVNIMPRRGRSSRDSHMQLSNVLLMCWGFPPWPEEDAAWLLTPPTPRCLRTSATGTDRGRRSGIPERAKIKRIYLDALPGIDSCVGRIHTILTRRLRPRAGSRAPIPTGRTFLTAPSWGPCVSTAFTVPEGNVFLACDYYRSSCAFSRISRRTRAWWPR